MFVAELRDKWAKKSGEKKKKWISIATSIKSNDKFVEIQRLRLRTKS